MWKAIFIESCLLSAIIFGGFYIHSKTIKEEIEVSEDSIKKLSSLQKLGHISGNNSSILDLTDNHLSGKNTKAKLGHISGKSQKHPTNKP